MEHHFLRDPQSGKREDLLVESEIDSGLKAEGRQVTAVKRPHVKAPHESVGGFVVAHMQRPVGSFLEEIVILQVVGAARGGYRAVGDHYEIADVDCERRDAYPAAVRENGSGF